MGKTRQNKKSTRKVITSRSRPSPTQAHPAKHPVLRNVQELTTEGILSLQQTAGNRSVTSILAQTASVIIQRVVTGSKLFKEKYEKAKKILQKSTTGRGTLAILDKYKINVKEGAAGSGTSYSSKGNFMSIDKTESAVDIALSIVHENNHAKAFHEGKWADEKKLSRKDYIKAEIMEEAVGTVKSIEAKMELEGAKVDVSKAVFVLERQYRKAYKRAIKKAKKADAKKPAIELRSIGRKAGLARVIKGFYKGEAIISTSKKPVTYPEYYGKIWDKANKKKK